MKRIILSWMLFAGLFTTAAAQNFYSVKDPIRLYQGDAPGSEGLTHDQGLTIDAMGQRITVNVTEPTITPYLPAPGTKNGAAIIILPGGGFKMLSIANEGENPAQWFASKGFTVFLLRYRTMFMGDDHNTITANLGQMLGVETGRTNTAQDNKEGQDQSVGMLQGVDKYIGQAADDARKAVEYVRTHAADYGIKPNKIAMMGFSAGCRTTLNVVYNHQDASHPDLAVAVYGQTDPHDALPASPMPLFITAPEHDIYGVPTSFELYRMWQQAKLPAELHYFTGAPHGFGLKPDGEPTNIWPKLAYNFMIKTGFIDANYLE